MKIIKPSFEILGDVDGMKILQAIELAGRTCYKSEDKITSNSAIAFVRMLRDRGHEAILEHQSISVKIVCDRGVSHEIVRHRIASYAQESTRYCNYSTDKFDNGITFIKPLFYDEGTDNYIFWCTACQFAEETYLKLIKYGSKPEQARSVLPNSLKTEIVCTFNLREWRHFFKLRTSSKAHPQMREITIPMLEKFKSIIPVVFDDIGVKE